MIVRVCRHEDSLSFVPPPPGSFGAGAGSSLPSLTSHVIVAVPQSSIAWTLVTSHSGMLLGLQPRSKLPDLQSTNLGGEVSTRQVMRCLQTVSLPHSSVAM